jgi:carbamoyltransferase
VSIVLGLNGAPFLGHDSAAALVVHGHIVSAVEEERLTRVKRAMGLPPTRSIHEVLDVAELTPRDVDIVALPWLPRAMGYSDAVAERDLRAWLETLGFRPGGDFEIRFVEHHSAHAWCGLAFVPGGLDGRRIGVLVLDGSGESTSGAAYVFDTELKRLWNLSQTSSLGIYYEAATHFLGFAWGEEGKTMGLAAYGRDLELAVPGLPDDRYDAPLEDWRPSQGSPKHRHERLRSELIGEFRRLHPGNMTFNARADVALSAQGFVIDRVMSYIRQLPAALDGLVLSGGLALNCTLNKTVAGHCRTAGIELTIPPPASDTGVALGAAIGASQDGSVLTSIAEPFLGAECPPDEIVSKLASCGTCVAEVASEELASLLMTESIICGWFEGRSEIGPRALGKRCIIARPDSTMVRDRVNQLKGREGWRPLAPSLTAAEFDRCFEGSVPSPHMLINAAVSCGPNELAGVIHVDGTSRPQVVRQEGPYRSLLSAVGARSGHEAVICTSFNKAGSPIVYSVEDALLEARSMRLDALAGDGWIVRL